VADEQLELSILWVSKNSEITINCVLTKVVIMLKNKCMLTHFSFLTILRAHCTVH